jgi:hypothetical protein
MLIAVGPDVLRAGADRLKVAAHAIALQPQVTETEEEKTAKRRFDATAAIAASLKKSMNNPDSLVWETIMADDAATIVCLEYRFKNNRGETQREYRTYANGTASETPENWNMYCAGRKLNNMLHVGKAF